MQFQIPQFIETESKIVGPLTLRQFMMIGVTGFVIFLLFFILETPVWIVLSGIIGIAGGAFAFVKINGRKLTVIFLAFLKFLWRPKFYLWKTPTPKTPQEQARANLDYIPQIELKQAAAQETPQTEFELPEEALEPPKELPQVSANDTPLDVSIPAPSLEASEVSQPPANTLAPDIILQPEEPQKMIAQQVPALEATPLEASTPPLPKSPPLPEAPKAQVAEHQKEQFIQQVEQEEKAKPHTKKSGGLKSLWLKLKTTSQSLGKREKKAPQDTGPTGPQSKEIFELFRKMSGEREVARRVDYR